MVRGRVGVLLLPIWDILLTATGRHNSCNWVKVVKRLQLYLLGNCGNKTLLGHNIVCLLYNKWLIAFPFSAEQLTTACRSWTCCVATHQQPELFYYTIVIGDGVCFVGLWAVSVSTSGCVSFLCGLGSCSVVFGARFWFFSPTLFLLSYWSISGPTWQKVSSLLQWHASTFAWVGIWMPDTPASHISTFVQLSVELLFVLASTWFLHAQKIWQQQSDMEGFRMRLLIKLRFL